MISRGIQARHLFRGLVCSIVFCLDIFCAVVRAEPLVVATSAYGATVRKQLNAELGCELPARPNSVSSCGPCLERLKAKLAADRKQIQEKIASAFGEQAGLSREIAPAVLDPVAALVANERAEGQWDRIMLVHAWSQEAARLGQEALKGVETRGGADPLAPIFHPGLRDRLNRVCRNSTSSLPRNDCLRAELRKVSVQANGAASALQDANALIHWASVATYACSLKASHWEPLSRYLAEIERKPLGGLGPSKEPLKAREASPRDARKLGLHPCMSPFQQAKRSSYVRDLDRSGVCLKVEGTELAGFAEEITRLMSNVQLQDYFTLLRMEGLSKFMAASYELTGKYPESPAACASFKSGIDEIRVAPPPAETSRRADLRKDPDYLVAASRTARRVSQLRSEAAELKSMPRCRKRELLDDPKACVVDPRYAPAMNRLESVRSELARAFEEFPFLKSGHAAIRPLEEDLPSLEVFARANPGDAGFMAEMDRAFESVAERVLSDITASMAVLCGDDPSAGGTGWEELVDRPQLTDPVLARFPEFQELQRCSLDSLETERRGKANLVLFAGLGCIPAAIATQGVAGYACTAAFSGKAYRDHATALERVYWHDQCLSAGSAVCDGQGLLEAQRDLESAAEELVLGTGAGLALNAVTLLKQARALRSLVSAAKDRARITGLAARVRGAKTVADAEAVADDLAKARIEMLAAKHQAAKDAAQKALLENEVADAAIDGLNSTDRRSKLLLKYGNEIRSVESETDDALLALVAKMEDDGVSPDEIKARLREWGRACAPKKG